MKARQLELFRTIQSEENADFQDRPLLRAAEKEYRALGRQDRISVRPTKNPKFLSVAVTDDYNKTTYYSVQAIKRNKSNNKFKINISLIKNHKFIPIKSRPDDPKGTLPFNHDLYHDFQDVVTNYLDNQEAIADSIREDDANMLQEFSEQDL